MNAHLHSVVLDCPDPDALARFYAGLLGKEISHRSDDWVYVLLGEGWGLAFQRAPDHRPPEWLDPERPQQIHLDVEVDDIEEAERKALELGAHPLRKVEEDADNRFRVYTDPAGHPFCLEY
ncbi:VOC family protein [Nocardiopsis sp. HNM0947]|uniref:VOC family protein n=1 Tax=Nocardiopsis coralli TaxID=2772213 RepID=A0ABR9P2J4_9ACTN|nr:VOC family protein [Nocardiopsis coralli]MBE2998059.1 VOC family protein [Nocardiopsis coralli]